MEDIEDLFVGAPPGFRLPVVAAVGVNPKSKSRNNSLQDSLKSNNSVKIPGTQVYLNARFYSHFFNLLFFELYCLMLQTIYMKTFGCSHNQVKHCNSFSLLEIYVLEISYGIDVM